MSIRRGTAADVSRALEIWRHAVDATHGFLTPGDRAEIDALVVAWLPTVDLWLIDDEGGRPVGFLVMDGMLIDALFVDPAVHRRGYGTALLDHALALAPTRGSTRASRRATPSPSTRRGVSSGPAARRPTRKAGPIR